jgi:NADH kinase
MQLVSCENTDLTDTWYRLAGSDDGEDAWQVMNEVTLHRGRWPHLTVVDAFFDGQHLTEAVVSVPRN